MGVWMGERAAAVELRARWAVIGAAALATYYQLRARLQLRELAGEVADALREAAGE